jgi:predicted permease
MDFLGLTFPFFALVLLGWLAARLGWLPHNAVPGLNGFVLFFALPCMLFRWSAQTPVDQILNPQILGVWLTSAVLMVALALACGFAIAFSWAKRARRSGGSGWDWNNASFGALVAAFPNSGFIGMPLLVSLLGPRAAGPTLVAICVDMVVTSSLCIALSRLGNAQPTPTEAQESRNESVSSPRQAATKALRGVLSNPLPWAIAAGCAMATEGLALPRPLMQPMAMLADAASPTALFTVGALLAQKKTSPDGTNGPHGAHGPHSGHWDIPAVVGLKLVVHPGLVFVLCEAAGLSAFMQLSLTLLAALPSASNVTLLAERYGANAERIAQIVLWSTAFGFLSFTALSNGLMPTA